MVLFKCILLFCMTIELFIKVSAVLFCDGTETGTITETIRVVNGADCVLDGASAGLVIVRSRGTLTVKNSAQISSLDADKPRGITVDDSTVTGQVDIKDDDGGVEILGSTFSNQVKIEESTSVDFSASTFVGSNPDLRRLEIRDNEGPVVVDGSSNFELRVRDNDDVTISSNDLDEARVEDNTGGVSITDNTIAGDLECKGNNPAPTLSGNTVNGDAEDQCAGA